MAKSNNLEQGILDLVFLNQSLGNIGDASGLQPSTTLGSFYIALYTTAPTDADSGTEATYTGYTRIEVPRGATSWARSENIISNVALITFPANTGTTETITHIGIRTAASLGDLVYHGQLSAPLVVENGNIPKFEIGDLAITEN